nr:hypothetical protein 24 [Elusimicrobiota bacterium]
MADIGTFVGYLKFKFDDKDVDLAERKLKNLKAGARVMLNNIGKAGLAMGTAFGAVATKAIYEAGQFQQQLQTVATMLDSTSEGALPKYRDALLEMSVKYAESTDTLSKGLYDILSAGVDSSKALDVLDATARAAKAGLTETGVAADAITTMLNSYGMEAEKAGDVSDWFFSVVKRGKTTFSELAPTVGRVGALSASAGLSMDELGAALATMTKSGIKTDEAVTSLRGVLTAFLKPTKDAKETAAELGVELSTNTLRTQGLVPILEKLSGATDEQVASIFGNVRALSGLQTILKDTSVYYEDLSFMQNKAGNTQEAFGKVTDTLMFSMGQFAKVVQVILVQFGTSFIPLIQNNLLPLFQNWSQNTDNIKSVSEGLTWTLKALISMVMGAVTAFKVVGDVIGATGAAVYKLATGDIKGFLDIIKQGSDDVQQTILAANENIQTVWADAQKAMTETNQSESAARVEIGQAESDANIARLQGENELTAESEKNKNEVMKSLKSELSEFDNANDLKTLESKRARIEEMLSNVQEGSIRELELKRELAETEKQIAGEAHFTIIGGFKAMLDEMRKENINFADHFVSMAGKIKNSMSDAFEDIFNNIGNGWDVLTDGIQKIGEAMKASVIRMVAEIASQWVMKHALMAAATKAWALATAAYKAIAAHSGIPFIGLAIGLGAVAAIHGAIKKFETGVRNFAGGLAIVGERGPELVNLPRGSDVFSNRDSKMMLAGAGAGAPVTVNMGDNHFNIEGGSDEGSISRIITGIKDAIKEGTMEGITLAKTINKEGQKRVDEAY